MRKDTALFIVMLLISSVTIADSPRAGAPVKLPELKAAASITRDVHGIAHIRANNEHDLFFLQGYVHAKDRLFQMDASRRRASGTLAELLGQGALASDVELRTIGLRRAAERSIQVLSDQNWVALKAYAAGVNAYVARNALPPEYAALELAQFTPWTALDSVTVAKLIAFGLSFDLGDIDRTVALLSYQAAGAVLGFDGTALFFEDLFRAAPFDPAATVPDSSIVPATPGVQAAGARAGKMDADIMALGKRYMKRLKKIPYLRRFIERKDPPGSNEWAVSGAHTETGFPLLANDPHLDLGTPSTFYPVHLKTQNIDVFGSGFAGAPFVIVGHNRHISWGATINPLDATDVFQEQVVRDTDSPSGLSSIYMEAREPIIPIPEVFRVNQIGNGVPDDLMVVPPGGSIPAATLIVPRRNDGPIIQIDMGTGTALSIQYTGFSATRELDTFIKWNVARGLDDFIDGLQFLDFGSVNLAYADTQGNIAYFTSAESPIREDLQMATVIGLPPFFIRNGSGGNEWLPVQNPQPGQAIPFEILPFAEMPQIINPPAGWFVNANNDPAGVSLDNNALNQLRPGGGIFYLNPAFDLGIRAGRVTELIEMKLTSDDRKISFAEMQQIQADVALGDAQVFVPFISAAFANAQTEGAHLALAALVADPRIVEAVGRLKKWDFTTPTGIPQGYDASDIDGMRMDPSEEEIAASVAASIYSVWRGRFINNTIDATLNALGLPGPGSRETVKALRNLLDNFATNNGLGASGLSFFNVPGVSDPNDRRDILILKSLRDALDSLASDEFAPAFANSTDQMDYRWGRLHRIVFEHPLGVPFSIPPAGGAFPAPLAGLMGIPTDGGFETVDASRHDVRGDEANAFMFDRGPVNRFVAETNRHRVRAESIWPGGTSGVLGDANYANLLPLWLTNDSIPLLTRNNEIKKNAATVTKFVPAKKTGKH